jgi:hypothetical protein
LIKRLVDAIVIVVIQKVFQVPVDIENSTERIDRSVMAA